MSFSLKYILGLILLILISLAYQIAEASTKGTMPRDIRQMTLLDVDDTVKLVAKKINVKEKNNEVFMNQVAHVLAEVVFVNPGITAREAGLSRVKNMLPQEDLPDALNRASQILLPLAQSSNAVDQATAMVGLANLVIEAKRLPKKEIKSTLQKIADANLEVSEEAREYGLEPLRNLVSPSEEAKSFLN